MPPNRRATKACARCRRRKTKFPQCSSCARANTECTGLDVVTGTELPRSEVEHLEHQIQQLESELDALDASQTSTGSLNFESALDALQSCLVNAQLGTQGESRPRVGGASNDYKLCEKLLLSPAPFTRALDDVYVTASAPLSGIGHKRGIPLRLVPHEVMAILLKNYKETYLVQYPFIDENELDASFSRIINSSAGSATEASHFDQFSVGMALAISAMTLIRYDEMRATTKAFEFWNAAKLHLPFVFDGPRLELLRSLSLLAHYFFLNPQAGDAWTCSGAALGLALEMGLQHETTTFEGKMLNEKERNQRRVLFWATYMMNG
ncbi:hypothetical protein A1O1_04550 [Capronia coronata CBS 617.96]|uniref:Zn(2)-C6 fungal-type domain-containing protein n=1 Tax=Capronia coronata CBS 617.96 TaxID=1182541 RepID=W9YFZ1_9EURO|nr:uncharacterized protein A1O1_04550 [Capronia coronata CBS 617.96]EXJ91438.1 hypothetical protein A1O1_04550 [Capronia coronata CBS 617.96]